MKNYLLIASFCCCIVSAKSQNVGIGTTTPVASAQLDITSTSKGFLPPRMTTAQKNAIAAPVEGLVIYQTDSVRGIYLYRNGAWANLGQTHFIGESYEGGIVFYVDGSGQHGLIAATADQASFNMRWFGGSYTNTCARADGIGAGLINTAIIIANQGPVDGATFAARVCNEYSITVNGVTYGGWYLPSKFELNLMYAQLNVIGGFATSSAYYWTSTENDINTAWIQSFINGSQGPDNKNQPTFKYVRACRMF